MSTTALLRYEVDASNFSKIPGSPIAYWVSNVLLRIFETAPLLGDIASTRQGFATGDNERFLRFWFEVSKTNVQKPGNRLTSQLSKMKWFPCNKGGTYRKWYGNNERYVNWWDNGYEMKQFDGAVIRNPNYYFHCGGTWSTIASNNFSMRFCDEGFLFESKGSMCFANDNSKLYYIIGLLNSVVVNDILLILSPTLDYHEGPVSRVPIVIDEGVYELVNESVEINIQICKEEWDSFETSWDFKKHPLI